MGRKLNMAPKNPTLHEYVEDGYKENIKFDAWYQRPEVWKKPKKQKLIDSILRGYDIGVIYLHKIDDPEYDYEVLDGQQRLRSINQFIDGEFKTKKSLNREIGSIGYEDLEETSLYPNWLSFKLHIQEIVSGDKESVADFFLRLQEGMELRTPEILNAIIGEMREEVIGLSEHSIFEKIGISDKRYKYRLLTAQAFKMEIDGDFNNRSFPDMKRDSLVSMYENHSNSVPRKAKSRVKKTFNKMDDVFDDASYIRNQGDFLPIYMLIRYLKKNFSINDKEDELESFIQKFLSQVEQVDTNSTNVPEEERPYYEYRIARRAGALSAESFKNRFDVILGKCMESIPDIDRKDEQRAFDYGQKLAIYYRDNGECQECGNPLEFQEAEFHHEEPYEKGGRTIVENGSTVHVRCHPRGG